MDLESLGGGAGAGLIGAILGVLGINRRVNKLEDAKQDKSICDSVHKGIDDKFKILVEGQKYVIERLDKLNEYIRNHRDI